MNWYCEVIEAAGWTANAGADAVMEWRISKSSGIVCGVLGCVWGLRLFMCYDKLRIVCCVESE